MKPDQRAGDIPWEALGIDPARWAATLPFGIDDATAGSEFELQAAVRGDAAVVDLPRRIRASNYFENVVRRIDAEESPRRAVTDLERFLEDNPEGVWENSWVRVPADRLNRHARRIVRADLKADKSDPVARRRPDVGRFVERDGGEAFLRVPVSYLLKLALAQVIGDRPGPALERAATRLLGHFSSDNSSPETFSFHVVPLRREDGMGAALARETGRRYLLVQALLAFANERMGLRATGQEALAWFSPLPPARLRALNASVADAFFRELFCSPCLSGWDRGFDKYRYMQLCHEVLSRSQLHAVTALRDAGIILNNLVVLPNASNISLANNGIHVSLGSRRLAAALSDPGSGFSDEHEKRAGDLVIKVAEHFLPLFAGTFSAAPSRLGFTDFHPESALGFLPHELHFTHLRMLWRRWKKKADLRALGRRWTPVGPVWLDTLWARMLGLRGDCVHDYRLVDYLVTLQSTKQSPALDGRPGNHERLKRDLTDLGVFDERMSTYLTYKQREFHRVGFSGFEGRSYSLFPSLRRDLTAAVDLQHLVTLYAYRLVVTGRIRHEDIPDTPFVESERRQPFFFSALGLPTFFVREGTSNRFLRELLHDVPGTRASRRYKGYVRVPLAGFRLALCRRLMADARELAEALGLFGTLRDLRARLEEPDRYGASGRLLRAVTGEERSRRAALRMPADEFNAAAERYYREDLRREQVREAADDLAAAVESIAVRPDTAERAALAGLDRPAEFVRAAGPLLAAGELRDEGLERFVRLVLLAIRRDALDARVPESNEPVPGLAPAAPEAQTA